jgi:hypothetical protein
MLTQMEELCTSATFYSTKFTNMWFTEIISSRLPQPTLTGTTLEVWKGKGRRRRSKGRDMKETMVSVKIEKYQQKTYFCG